MSTPAPLPPGASASVSAPILAAGSAGAAVAELQARLLELGYWTGDPSGRFADATKHAVVALQKAARLSPDGIVGARTQAALEAGVRPSALSRSGRVVEVDLPRQILMLVSDGHVEEILDVSTGGPHTPTPRGRFSIYRQIDGVRTSALGRLYRPKYFDRGYAIHGYPDVPNHPVSHGCVRVTNEAMDRLWTNDLLQPGTDVWVY